MSLGFGGLQFLVAFMDAFALFTLLSFHALMLSFCLCWLQLNANSHTMPCNKRRKEIEHGFESMYPNSQRLHQANQTQNTYSDLWFYHN
eukprot:m.14131 g.14131  ORF g.14131 m.14131 type:complete len:89 (-) comp7516_c0_seq1:72-338(-)